MTDPTPSPLTVNPAKRWKLEHRLAVWLGNDLSTPRGRKRAWWAVQLIDHQFLRRFWHNFYQIAPDAYRSNQPDGTRLAYYKSLGIKGVLSLRGHNNSAMQAFQKEACAKLDMPFHAVALSARKLVEADKYLELLDIFDRIERPFLFHCKSGADRTGIAAAFYLIEHEGKSVAEVQDQLSWTYYHSRTAATGVLDWMLAAYGKTGEAAGMDLRTWLREVYDPAALTADFKAASKAQRRQQ